MSDGRAASESMYTANNKFRKVLKVQKRDLRNTYLLRMPV